MENIIETITSSNLIFFSIIGFLLLIILIMILLIKKENKSKLNNVLDETKAVKVLEEKEITDTIAIPNIENDNTVTFAPLDSNINNNFLSNITPVAGAVEDEINPNTDNDELMRPTNTEPAPLLDQLPTTIEEPVVETTDNQMIENSGATISDTTTLPTITDDEIIEPIYNPFNLVETEDDKKTFDEIDKFTNDFELPALKNDEHDFELPIENKLEPLPEEEPILLKPTIDIEEPIDEVVEEIKEEGEPVEKGFEQIIELPKEEKIELPIEIDEQEEIELPITIEEPKIIAPTEEIIPTPEPVIEEQPVIEQPVIEEQPVVTEEQIIERHPLPELKDLPQIVEEDDEEDGKYNYDEDEDEEIEGTTLSELTGGEVTDDNLEDLKNKLEEREPSNVIHLTSYEEEQEEKAIISYDELIAASDQESIDKHEAEQENSAIDIRDIKTEEEQVVETTTPEYENYDHEEAFLDMIKTLRDELK